MFDEEDDVGSSIIPDMSLPNEDEEEELKLKGPWEYAINDLFQLSPVHAEGEIGVIFKKKLIEQDITIGTPQTSYKDNT